MSKIDLDELERIARAADKDNPGVCYSADHVDGYPMHDSAMALFNAMDPATTLSLIRRIRVLEALARWGLGQTRSFHGDPIEGDPAFEELRDGFALLTRGVTRYGRAPRANDERWDIDQPAED